MLRFVTGLFVVCCTGWSAMACLMLPASYEGMISQNAHEGVIIHADGREELVIRINYQIVGKTLPDNFAWVITVPNEPDDYAIADASLFEEMFTLSEKLRPPPKKRKLKSFGGGAGGALGGGTAGVELGNRVEVGPYDIQPVRGVGANALTGLNNWLETEGYPTEDRAHMEYFVANQFTFLCIRIAAQNDNEAVNARGLLPPLHLSFASPKPYYPLRFSSRQGVFDVNLHVLMKRALKYRTSGRVLRQINWTNRNFKRNYRLQWKRTPETLKAVLAASRFKDDRSRWFYNNIRGNKVNRDNEIAHWTTDVFFNGPPRGQKIAGRIPKSQLANRENTTNN